MTADAQDPRLSEVWARLAEVTDPELDEPVTELGFVRDVAVEPAGGDADAAHVTIDFKLPTYWCAANFAFLMADDMRAAVNALPWVATARPRLLEHMYADEVNAGVADGRSFSEAFGDAADGESLDGLREMFQRKAFQRRQEVVLRALLDEGTDVATIIGMTVATLEALAIVDADGAKQKPRYLAARRRLGGPRNGDDPAFVTIDGAPLVEATFSDYLASLRSVRINMEFNGAVCRGLLAVRDDVDAASSGADPREPGLVDFLPGGSHA